MVIAFRRFVLPVTALMLLHLPAHAEPSADGDAGAAKVLQVNTDFPGGSAKVLAIDQQDRLIRLNPSPHQDRGWAVWWYIHVRGITPGETISLDVGDAPWATPDRAAFSTDNVNWTQTATGQRDAIAKRILYTQQIDAGEAWFAWGPPFLPQDTAELFRWAVQQCPHAEPLELCRTRQQRPVLALRIVEPGVPDEQRSGIWVQARQHAWESGSSWVCHGMIDWLVSDDPRAVRLRRQATITFVPIMDVDNVTFGAGGKNQVPHDHNRDWTDNPYWPEVAAAMRQIKQQDAAGRFDLFIDLHNPGARSKHPFYYVTPRSLLREPGPSNLDRFLLVSRLEMDGPLSYVGETEESGPGYDAQWKTISKNWVSLNTRPHVVAVTLETAWNTPHSTTGGYQTLGRQLGMAVERYLRTSPRAEATE
jgi:hypothetical protein